MSYGHAGRLAELACVERWHKAIADVEDAARALAEKGRLRVTLAQLDPGSARLLTDMLAAEVS